MDMATKLKVGVLVAATVAVLIVWVGAQFGRRGPAGPAAAGGFVIDGEWDGPGVYFLGIDTDLDGHVDLVKIGFSKNVSGRPDDGRTFNPFPLHQLLVHPTATRDEAQEVETAYHRQFKALEVELEGGGTEWFVLDSGLERFLAGSGARLARPVEWAKHPTRLRR